MWNIFTQKLFSSYIPTSVLPFSTTSTRVWLENNMTTTGVLDKKKYSILSKKKLSAWSSSSKITTIVSQPKKKKWKNLSKEEKKILKYLTIQICPLRCNNNGLIQPPKWNQRPKKWNKFTALLFCFEFTTTILCVNEWMMSITTTTIIIYSTYLLNISWNFSEEKKVLIALFTKVFLFMFL